MQMHKKPIFVLLLASLCSSLYGQDRTAVSNSVTLHAELVSQLVYPGEVPRVRIKVIAPADQSVEVVKSTSARKTGALRASLIGNDGMRVPGGLPHDAIRPPLSSDFVRLEAGEQHVIEVSILTRVPAPGRFLVRINFAGGPDGSQVLRTDLVLTCREILPAMISGRYLVHGADDQEQLELLKVTDNGVCELVFRSTHSKYGVRVVARLFEIAPNAEIIAVFRPRVAQEVASDQIWFCWSKSTELWLGQMNTLTGRVVMTKPALGNDER